MHDIFLSYSTKDRERLQPLFNALENRGWSVFWDHRTIEIGDHWSKKINHAIRTSKCVLVVWSANSIESEWVLEEANIGKQRDVFLPIRIDDVIFPVGFTMRQAGDFVDWSGDVQHPEFVRLVEKIAEFLARHDAESQRKADAIAAEQQRLAKEQALAEQQAREAAERQRRLDEEAQRQREAVAAAEKVRLAQEKAAADQKAREARALEQAERKKREQAAAEDTARRAAEAKAKQPQPFVDGSALGELTSPFWKKRPFQFGAAALSVAAVVIYMQQPSAVTPKPVAPITLPATAPVVAAPAIPAKKPESKSLPFEPEMADIPAGEFMMGCDGKRDDVEGGCSDDEKPAHKVKISGFKLAKTEVTFDQWDACEKAKACPHAEDQGWGRGNRPVINVSWDDITQKYIPWLNKKTGKSYRLPTEAEWEYAARGGADTAYPWGNAIGKENANCGNNECGDMFEYTAPVGSFAANGYGLSDMHGNVWEWCQDWYESYSSFPVSNPKGAVNGTERVFRGGAWGLYAHTVRSASRFYNTPDYWNGNVGFRVVLPITMQIF